MKQTYSIIGMSCAACSAAVERVTKKIDGVTFSQVNLTTGKLNIEFDETKVHKDMIIQKVKRAGFDAVLDEDKLDAQVKETTQPRESKEEKVKVTFSLVFAFLLLYICMLPMVFGTAPLPTIIDMHHHPVNNAIVQMLLTLFIFFLGRKFFKRGIKALRYLKPNMDSLVTIGSITAFVYSLALTFTIDTNPHAIHNLYFESAGVVLALVMFGKYLESRSKKKTSLAISKLMELAPDEALVEVEGQLKSIKTKHIKVGDIIVITPGSRIPVDARVISGTSAVDESAMTGESLPVYKETGSEIVAGTLNQTGMLRASVTATGEHTKLFGIVKFMQDAQGKKAPIASLADKVAGVFVPLVIAIAVITSIAWLIAGKDIAFVLNVFVAVLVIACPCAMGLATPTAIVVATGKGASNGILIRNGEVLQKAKDVDVVLFDKTGTLTVGRPEIKSIHAIDGDENALLQLCAKLEQGANHPLSLAVLDEAKRRNLTIEPAPEELINIPGKGISATIEGGETILIGSQRLMEESAISIEPLKEAASFCESSGETLLFIAKDKALLGLISLSDSVKDGAKEAVEELQKLHLTVGMVSGDKKAAAESIAKKLGIDFAEAEVLPEDKAKIVEKYQKMGKKVMMVGDGINDAPALAQADVGVAIGNGTDIAIEAADIILMQEDLIKVKQAIHLSHISILNIKQNLFWAFFYNTVGIPIAAGLLTLFGGPLLNPVFAGLAMSLSSVSVVGNALRINAKKL